MCGILKDRKICKETIVSNIYICICFSVLWKRQTGRKDQWLKAKVGILSKKLSNQVLDNLFD